MPRKHEALGAYGKLSLEGNFDINVSDFNDVDLTAKDGRAMFVIGHPPPPGGLYKGIPGKPEKLKLKKNDTVSIDRHGDLSFPL